MPVQPEDDNKYKNKGYLHPYLDGTYYHQGVGEKPKTLIELAMCHLSASIRTRDVWWKVYKDADVRTRWMNDALEKSVEVYSGYQEDLPSDKPVDVKLTAKQIDYVLDELEGYEALRDEINHCEVSCFDRIWQSNASIFSTGLRSLNASLDLLEARPDPDYPVESYLIDPSSSLVYNSTLVYDTETPGLLRPEPPPEQDYAVSTHSAILPADFLVSPSGNVSWLSYIPDLYPSPSPSSSERKVYRNFTALLTVCIPLFEHVVTDLHRTNSLPYRITGTYHYEDWDEPSEPEDEEEDEERWAEYKLRYGEWEKQRRVVVPDVPKGGYPGGLEERRCFVKLRDRVVQVITEVKEIHLSPERPTYCDNSWRVAGMKNEAIVACLAYFPLFENVVGGSITFRTAITFPKPLIPYDSAGIAQTYGLTPGAPCTQILGTVPVHAGRAVAWPNIYSHRYSPSRPFRLADPAKPGRARIISFYLCDPDKPVISTARVPPTRKEWVERALALTVMERVPVEIIERIVGAVPGLLSEAEVRKVRREARVERQHVRADINDMYFGVLYDIGRA
ncbi:hypothetical protein OE88DRAFT_1649535 [Heliocybe sulcata]|uniref:DUF4246 domain-containing protein n=1 Tax=Heliocybe sulcata TaxID=5364 RepID=A0A5C3NIM7_9AGAM|nr:hypothetical protein OE88DRAFT_1649535 [Heliocybe sulcata]